MQFHLNGFRPGDPRRTHKKTVSQAPRDHVDVLIVGCGPAGLTLAAQLASIPGISTRIIEQKPGPLEVGQADGIACRTMEMFQAFGFAGSVAEEAYWVSETSFWRPASNGSGIARAERIQDVEDDLSEFPHTILNQARVHDFYLDVMANAPAGLVPDYGRRLTALDVDETSAFPVRAQLDCLDAPGRQEALHSRFVVGCDGARSIVRRFLGHELRGEAARQLWGVMDVLAVTDFPDIRLKSAIQSADKGSLLIIPREGGYLVRMYIELDELRGHERAADRNVSPEMLAAKARAVLSPFALDVKEVAWWSAYEIGQRVCDAFDDVPEAERPDRAPRVFIAGDACHTHSPKAGQGMNVSMADTFNLGWKLAAVVRGEADPRLLHTYSAERRSMARELIDFDRDMARLFSARRTSADADEFQRYFQKHGRYTAGVETRYDPSLIVGQNIHQSLAKGQTIGMRFHSAPVIRLGDARPVHLGHVLKADGRWRIFAFAGRDDHGGQGGRMAGLCRFLGSDPRSPMVRYSDAGTDPDAPIDLRAVFQAGHRDLVIENMPPLLLPRKGRYGLVDYEKIFCPDLRGGSDIFALRGIDRQGGAMIIVRPDQFVAHVLPLDAYDKLAGFFDGFMVQKH